MEPPGEHLDGDGLDALRADPVEIASVDVRGRVLERVAECVEVDDHAALVELPPTDDRLDAVVVRVPLALGGRHPRHHVERPQANGRPDLIARRHR